MKTKEEPITLSPKVLEAVKDLVNHTVPLLSLRAWWEVQQVMSTSDFNLEDDEHAKTFWNDMYFIGNILFALHEDAIGHLKAMAREKRKPMRKKKGGSK